MAKTVSTILKLKDQFTGPMGNCAKAVEKYNNQAKKTNKSTEILAKNIKGNLAKAAKAAGTSIVALGSVVAAAGIKYNAEMEMYQSNFKVMLGSEEAAIKKVNELKKMAAATPFEMKDLADATKQMLAMGIKSEDTGKYLKQLGDISLGDSQKLNTLVNSFGKMSSSGKVTLEYINMMAEQGFNPLNLIAQKTGESMKEVYERVSKGKVAVKEVAWAFDKATSKGGQFYKGMEEGSKTMLGQVSTLKDNLNQLAGTVMEPVTKWITEKGLPLAIEKIEQLQKKLPEIKDSIKNAIPIITGVGTALAAAAILPKVIGIFKAAKAIITCIKGAGLIATIGALANPIGLIAVAVGGLVALFVKLNGGIGGAIAKIKEFIQGVKDFFTGKTLSAKVESGEITRGKPVSKAGRRRNALGTSYFSGGYTGFSEGGRAESAIFPSGTKIIPASEAGKDDSKPINVFVTIQGNVIGNKDFMEMTGQYVAKRIRTALANS